MMCSVSPRRLLAFAVPFLLIPLTYAAVPPSWIDLEYRDCMAMAAEIELDDRIALYDEYYEASLEDLRWYRRSVRDAWTLGSETQRKTYLKQADREYATLGKNRSALLGDRLKSLKETRTDREAACKARQSESVKFTASLCTSSVECTGGKTCSTEKGVCNGSCPYGSIYCPNACAGTCIKP
jgi:hypothetical protein